MVAPKFISTATLASILVGGHVLPTQAQTLTTLYDFEGGSDGAYPSGLIYAAGALYGTTVGGGNTGCGGEGCGIMFKMDPGTGAKTVLHVFADGQDGAEPGGQLSLRGAAIFGTTYNGGAGGGGTAYKIKLATGVEKILFGFSGGANGESPNGVTTFHQGALYGTTYSTVFRLDPRTHTETTLHSFTGMPDGAYPNAGLSFARGRFYGTTLSGGLDNCQYYAGGCGTVYQIDPATGKESVLYAFAGGADGQDPDGPLVYLDGFLYGATTIGASGYCYAQDGCGTIFRIDVTTGTGTVLHTFTGGTDGGNPYGGLTYYKGALYGTASEGGKYICDPWNNLGCGVVYKIDPKTGKQTVLYNFTGGADGAAPSMGLVLQDGVFYGTTGRHFNQGYGTVFKFKP
jgi:uncharacterized repeat protein (TIGR03803 family)